jgi:hypothetical protein
MHDFLYNLGLISITIIIFYIVFWFDRRNKPTDFDLIRNHLQRITHPHLTVKGFGKYHIEYVKGKSQIIEYFNNMSKCAKELETLKKDSKVKIIDHGLVPHNQWEKWKI